MSISRGFASAVTGVVIGALTWTSAFAQNTDRSRPFTPYPATAMERAQLDEDVQLLMTWLEGQWSSEAQVTFQDAAGIPEDLRHGLHEDAYVRVEAPALGPHVLYSEKRNNGKVFTKQYWVLTPLYDSRVIENSIYLPKPDNRPPDGAWTSPAQLKNPEIEDLRAMAPGCSTYWQRRDNHFDVEIQGECQVVEINGKMAYHGARSALTPTKLLMYLFELNSEGKQVGGNMAGIPRVLTKIETP